MHDLRRSAASPEEDLIEEFYGTGFMATLSTRLGVLAETGTVREPYYGSFDMRFYTNQFLYGVKQDGTLTWHQHVITEDRNPPGVGTAAVSRFKNVDVLAVQPRADAGRGACERDRECRNSQQVAGQSVGRRTTQAAGTGGARQTAGGTRAHHARGQRRRRDRRRLGRVPGHLPGRELRDVRAHGGRHSELVPPRRLAGREPEVEGPGDAGEQLAPVPADRAGGDGVLYAVDQNGSLLWYRHDDYRDARSPSSWQGPSLVGTGWGHFVGIFSSGEGVIYAVQPDGTLLWYRHTGYGGRPHRKARRPWARAGRSSNASSRPAKDTSTRCVPPASCSTIITSRITPAPPRGTNRSSCHPTGAATAWCSHACGARSRARSCVSG
ncbi:MAG: tachylectin-related carbohydrate-binding protein [Gammaproteobacteria bacterium]|nr:tachylectin-related carbohydrate-binding protein [Gammaproteobacteria bacterium]